MSALMVTNVDAQIKEVFRYRRVTTIGVRVLSTNLVAHIKIIKIFCIKN